MLRVAICEDLREDAEQLRSAVESAGHSLSLSLVVDVYESGEALLDTLATGCTYNLLLTDIYMAALSGVETASRAQKLLPDLQIAFISTSRDYAPEAFALDALHYLVKPVAESGLREVLSRYLTRTSAPKPTLRIQAGSREYVFSVEKVEKIQSSNKGVAVYVRGVEQPVRVPISCMLLQTQLDPRVFLKISRGLFVHMRHIVCIDKDVCRLRDGTEALLSRRERAEIRKRYNDWLFSK